MTGDCRRGYQTYLSVLRRSISAISAGISSLACATKSWSSTVAPNNSMSSSDRDAPSPIIIKFEPESWSRPSTYDFQGPGRAASHLFLISSIFFSDSGSIIYLLINNYLLGLGTVGLNSCSACCGVTPCKVEWNGFGLDPFNLGEGNTSPPIFLTSPTVVTPTWLCGKDLVKSKSDASAPLFTDTPSSLPEASSVAPLAFLN